MSRLWHAAKVERALGTRRSQGPTPTWAEGYAEGLAIGRATVEAELEADRAALTALVTAIETLAPPSAEALTPVLGEVAARLAIAAAGTAMIDADLLAARAHACGALLADELPPTRLCFHPDDFAALDIDALSYPAVSAADVERGSVRAEAGAAWAADGVREAIARIVAEVGL